MAETPKIAGRTPIPLDAEEGKTYWWCSCGRSANQPLCDGSHKPTEFTPHGWTAPETKRVFFCTCKQTSTPPLCDGTHGKLAE